MTPPAQRTGTSTSRTTKSDGSAAVAQERMLKKLTDELTGLVQGVHASNAELR